MRGDEREERGRTEEGVTEAVVVTVRKIKFKLTRFDNVAGMREKTNKQE